jgi:hypothetical protein
MLGLGFTVTVTVAVPVQPPVVAVTEYVVFPVGLIVIAVVVAPVLHKYVPPPLAVNVVLVPLQMVVVPVIVVDGGVKILTCTVAVPVQVPLVTVTL